MAGCSPFSTAVQLGWAGSGLVHSAHFPIRSTAPPQAPIIPHNRQGAYTKPYSDWTKWSSHQRKSGAADAIQCSKDCSAEARQTQMPQTTPKCLSNAAAISLLLSDALQTPCGSPQDTTHRQHLFSSLYHCLPFIFAILNSEIGE